MLAQLEGRMSGRFESPLALYAYELVSDGSSGGVFTSSPDGFGWAEQIGRHVIHQDGQGFVDLTRCASVTDAVALVDGYRAELEPEETCGFTSPCSPEPERPCELQPGHAGPHGYRAELEPDAPVAPPQRRAVVATGKAAPRVHQGYASIIPGHVVLACSGRTVVGRTVLGAPAALLAHATTCRHCH